MKAIYTVIDGNVYKIDKNLNIPSIISSDEETNMTGFYDSRDRHLEQKVVINTILNQRAFTNKESYRALIKLLKDDNVINIPVLNNYYCAAISYTLKDEDENSILENSVVYKPLKVYDEIVPIGVSRDDNECVYRRSVRLKGTFDFSMKSNIPFGVMENSRKKISFNIYDISVFQELKVNCKDNGRFDGFDIHRSTEVTPYAYGSKTLKSIFETSKLVFSTSNDDISFNKIVIDRSSPRNVTIPVTITLGNFIVVYDDDEINSILKRNYDHLNPSNKPSGIIKDHPCNKEDRDELGRPIKHHHEHHRPCNPDHDDKFHEGIEHCKPNHHKPHDKDDGEDTKKDHHHHGHHHDHDNFHRPHGPENNYEDDEEVITSPITKPDDRPHLK